MEVVPGKLGQRGINLPAEKTPNVGNPQKTNTNVIRKIATTILCKRWQSCHLLDHRFLLIFRKADLYKYDESGRICFSGAHPSCKLACFFSNTDLLTLIRVAKTVNVSLLNYERCGRGGKGARRSKITQGIFPMSAWFFSITLCFWLKITLFVQCGQNHKKIVYSVSFAM